MKLPIRKGRMGDVHNHFRCYAHLLHVWFVRAKDEAFTGFR
jgi:hypothetical protein